MQTKDDEKRPLIVKSVNPVLEPGMTTAEAFRVILLNCLDHMDANHAALAETRDGEGVHQMRVALRRLRSALRSFKTIARTEELARMRHDIVWLGGVLGPARDLDVFVHEIIQPAVNADKRDDDLRALVDDFGHMRDEAVRLAAEAVATERFLRLDEALRAWAEEGDWTRWREHRQRKVMNKPVGQFAAKTLDKADRLVRRGGTRNLRKLAPAERHALRIEIKRLRYAAQFFSSLGDDPHLVKYYLNSLGVLQDGLGALNDRAVAARILASHLAGEHGENEARAARKVLEFHRDDDDAILDDLKKECHRYRSFPPFWK